MGLLLSVDPDRVMGVSFGTGEFMRCRGGGEGVVAAPGTNRPIVLFNKKSVSLKLLLVPGLDGSPS